MNLAEQRFFEISKKIIGKRFLETLCGRKIVYKILSVTSETKGVKVLRTVYYNGKKVRSNYQDKFLFFGVYCTTKLKQF